MNFKAEGAPATDSLFDASKPIPGGGDSNDVYTKLTMNFKPVTGVIPPLSHEAWMAAFERYQQIPQYQLVNRGMSLHDFQSIYWWEWTHRLLGRIVGLVFFVPLIGFIATRRMPKRLIWRAWLLLALGALQGVVGWWMVVSGLSVRVAVAPERLATHLGLALILFCLLIWTALEAWSGPGRPERR